MQKESVKSLGTVALFLVLLLLLINTFGNFNNKDIISTKAVDNDITAPSVSITNQGGSSNNPSLLVTGTASDNNGIREIKVKLNNGNWETAQGTSSWSKQVYLSPGANIVYAQAFDYSDNPSPVSAKAFNY